MKALYGLILAIGLGISAAMLNFVYLNAKSKDIETIEFVGIAEDTVIDRGRNLTQDDLVPVPIPAGAAGNLKDFALLYSARRELVGQPVWRPLSGGNLLLRDDIRTPPDTLNLGPGWGAIGVPFDAKSFPPSLIIPGDRVSFVFNRVALNLPHRAVPGASADPTAIPDPEAGQSTGATETIGPFIVLSLGTRLGTSEVTKAHRQRNTMENVMTIKVRFDENGEKMNDPKAQKLLDWIHSIGTGKVSIELHPREKKIN